MSPSPFRPNAKSQTRQSAQETQRMSILMNRFLDVAASVLIVFLASVTAGATAILGA
ncbi:MAG TPA: hypothetical protein VGC92_09850 [Phenylobacterium sp.]|jgi:hypothetical protein